VVDLRDIRAGVVGCGRRFLSAIAPVLSSAGARIVLAVDPSSQAFGDITSSAAPVLTAPALTGELLRDAAPDVVIVASPSGLHFNHAAIALDASIPTFVEKPIACTSAQAHAIGLRNGVRLSISEQRPHRTDLKIVRHLIRGGWFGALRRIHYHDFVQPVAAFATSWRNEPELAGGGVLLDLGYHTISALYWLLPEYVDGLQIHSVALGRGRFRVEHEAQVQGIHGETSIALHIGLTDRAPREVLVVDGEDGSLELRRDRRDGLRSTVVLRARGGQRTIHIALSRTFETESIRRFLDGVADDHHIRRHVRTVEFLDQVYRREDRG
jgi:predicted dehydrogenase